MHMYTPVFPNYSIFVSFGSYLGILNYFSNVFGYFSFIFLGPPIGWSEKHIIIIKRLKNICSDLLKLRLLNKNDNLILQTNAPNKYWQLF